ncbi:MAG TPA: hypothetical protein DC054_07325 [Blastocatellia bacterium]|nr:hypothetical protein [Blastocatellia bacterium]
MTAFVAFRMARTKQKPPRFLATAELVLAAWATWLAEVGKTSWSIESRGEFSPGSKTNERRLN